MQDAQIIGAAVLPPLLTGYMGEYMVVEDLKDKTQRKSSYAKLGVEGKAEVGKYNDDTIGMFGTLFMSDGEPGDVLKVEVKGRIGEEGNFVNAIRAGLR